ncbi:hypothetical protein GCM10010357_54840 [Streptomyces luteireticuli]|uniref:Uncharacterized protein n=1 Tax=Streptomyces luteireticuli TaxID=173858 RepID=A0ABP3IWL6_9ACTN
MLDKPFPGRSVPRAALDYVTGPALEQGHEVALYAPLMFRREARRRGVEFHRAGTDWTCDPAVQQAVSEIWKESGNAPFNRYVFGRLRPDRAEAKARDLIAAWTRSRPDLVIAGCGDLGAHLAAKVLDLPVVAAGNGLGPVLLDLWDTDIAPASPPPASRSSNAPHSPRSCTAPTCSSHTEAAHPCSTRCRAEPPSWAWAFSPTSPTTPPYSPDAASAAPCNSRRSTPRSPTP